MSMKSIVVGVVVLGAAFLTLSSVFIVTEREQALVVQFGDPRDVVTEPGLHFKTPFVQQVIYLEKRIMSLDLDPEEFVAGDKRKIMVDSFARFRIIDPLKSYQAAGTTAKLRDLLENILDSTARQVLGKENMQSIVSGERAELMRRITEIATQQAETLGVEVVDVRLKRVDLPEANSKKIFEQMKSERNREAAEFRARGGEEKLKIESDADRQVSILIANAEKTSQIIRGEADAKAIKIFADAYNQDKEFFDFYRTMQAYKKAISSDDTTLILSPDSAFLKMFTSDALK